MAYRVNGDITLRPYKGESVFLWNSVPNSVVAMPMCSELFSYHYAKEVTSEQSL